MEGAKQKGEEGERVVIAVSSEHFWRRECVECKVSVKDKLASGKTKPDCHFSNFRPLLIDHVSIPNFSLLVFIGKKAARKRQKQ